MSNKDIVDRLQQICDELSPDASRVIDEGTDYLIQMVFDARFKIRLLKYEIGGGENEV